MSAFNREKLGWEEPNQVVAITRSGTYTVSAAELDDQEAQFPRIYYIPTFFEPDECLIIESRQPLGYDRDLPVGGLAIYHVDLGNSLNDEGYPGQDTWPLNGRHYRLALLPADGKYELERGVNRGEANDLFRFGGNNTLGPSINVASGPFPNTDSYAGNTVYQTGIEIRQISAPGNEMSFEVFIPGTTPVTEATTTTSTTTTTTPTTTTPTTTTTTTTTTPEQCLPGGAPASSWRDCCSLSWQAKVCLPVSGEPTGTTTSEATAATTTAITTSQPCAPIGLRVSSATDCCSGSWNSNSKKCI